MNVPLLQRLKGAAGEFVPVASLGDDAEAVSRALREIEGFGYAIERHPYLGVAYRGPSERLCPDLIEWELGVGRVGRRVAVWDRVSSTNDLAARAGRSRANDGLVILAEEQTAGRGRRGRSWSAARGASILMSVVLFPSGPIADPGWLTALGAVATAEVVEQAIGRPARIKWPNDVRVAGRKVAGVLAERGSGSILGIGLNVNASDGDFPDEIRASAASLRGLAGEPLDRSEIARSLIRRLDCLYQEGLAQGPEALLPLWLGRLEALGRPVVLTKPSGEAVSGRLVHADLAGGITLEDAQGRGPAIRAGGGGGGSSRGRASVRSASSVAPPFSGESPASALRNSRMWDQGPRGEATRRKDSWRFLTSLHSCARVVQPNATSRTTAGSLTLKPHRTADRCRVVPGVEPCEDRALMTLVLIFSGNAFGPAGPGPLTVEAARILKAAGEKPVQVSYPKVATAAAFEEIAHQVAAIGRGRPIGLVGLSAGGTLAVRLSTIPGLNVKAVLDDYGPPDLRTELDALGDDQNGQFCPQRSVQLPARPSSTSSAAPSTQRTGLHRRRLRHARRPRHPRTERRRLPGRRLPGGRLHLPRPTRRHDRFQPAGPRRLPGPPLGRSGPSVGEPVLQAQDRPLDQVPGEDG